MSSLRAPAQERELQHSPSRNSKLKLVHCNILGYKLAASGGLAELSPVMSEKPGPAWEQGVLEPSQGKPPQCPRARAFADAKDQALLKSSQVIHEKWILNRLRRVYHNTPAQLPSPGAMLRVANSYDFRASLAILAIFLKA